MTNKNTLYDTYKMAIRWASDRIGEQGMIAFVTNGSWIDGNTDAGIRACLAKEFSSVHVLHLRGNQRTQGERSRREGGKIFGSGSRAPVAISIFVKNPNATHDGCKIKYRDIGDYLTREEKLETLRDKELISGFTDWDTITPDKHHDWIEQRSEAFAQFYPMGSKEAKAGKADNMIFELFSNGFKTGRDAYIYNFSRDTCADNAEQMTQTYLAALSELKNNPELTMEELIQRHNSNIKWDRELKNNLKRMKETEFDKGYIQKFLYRPFVATNGYADYTFVQMKYQMDRIFVEDTIGNLAICIPGIGSKKPFSAIMTSTMPDLGFNEACQCFPQDRYQKPTDTSETAGLFEDSDEELECIDNISDTALQTFGDHYRYYDINKDDIFDYVYGILHAPNYREQFANDLSKMLPRIPFAPDFNAFIKAGSALGSLHIDYDECEQYPLKVEFPNITSPPADLEDADPNLFLLTNKAMKFMDAEKRVLAINDNVRISGIPEDAWRYVVNGRTPLEWFIDRYYIKTDKDSGIVNDPNGWFEDPRDLVTAIKRIVYVSVESARIIDNLPTEITDG